MGGRARKKRFHLPGKPGADRSTQPGLRLAGNALMDTCRDVYYAGTVQGVGFRFTARGLAQRYAVNGYVQNLRDGRVEVVAVGEQSEVEAYLEALREAMKDYIADEQGSWTTRPEHFETFDIRF